MQRRMTSDPPSSPSAPSPTSPISPTFPTRSTPLSPTSPTSTRSPLFSPSTSTRSPLPTGSASGSARQPVVEPASFSKFAAILMMYGCKRILLIRTGIRLLIYLAFIFTMSLVTDHFPFPKSYFSNKRNVLNQYFVKFGWGWTCSIVGLFIYFTSRTYCCAERRLINRHFCRLAVSTAWWYISVSIFEHIHSTVGMCSIAQRNTTDTQPVTRETCEGSGRRWVAFDVSGHAFLLIHCLLIISEEAKAIGNGWERIEQTLAKEQSTGRMNEEEVEVARESNSSNAMTVRWITLAMTLLSLLWDIMLASTVLYFHNMPQKFIGALFAVVGWAVTYRLWYTFDTWWSPGLPGQGKFKYLKD